MTNDFAPGVYAAWLSSDKLSAEERAELESIVDNEKEIESRFFAPPEFGTAGLRGVMGVGLRLINVHVIRWVTQAFAEILLEDAAAYDDVPADTQPRVAVCYDCRENSHRFAVEISCVLAANGLHVLLFEDMRPTPELSYAVREYNCAGGINVTASHNTREYNGYKVYGSNGAQLSTEKSKRVSDRMNAIDIFGAPKSIEYEKAVEKGLIALLGAETDEKFLAESINLPARTAEEIMAASELKITYTPFHGTGYKLVPEALRRLGFGHVTPVASQSVPDGSFPTVKSPNPENPESFALAEETAKETGADLIIGTDPDADRLAIEVLHNGQYVFLTGNITGALMLDYILMALTRDGRLPHNSAAIKTIVTSNLADKIAASYGAVTYDTFTGFKFIADKKDYLETMGEATIVFSFEESYGYMPGSHTRDKDAVMGSALAAVVAAYHKSRGKTLVDAIEELYTKFGYHAEETVNLVMPGLDGMSKMAQLMKILRIEPPEEIAGIKVKACADFKKGTESDGSGHDTKLKMSGSDVLRFTMETGDRVLVRPSGTEPKIKVYILCTGFDLKTVAERASSLAAWARDLPAREL